MEGRSVFPELYDTTKDENFTTFSFSSIKERIKAKCPISFSFLHVFVTSSRDDENGRRTREYKLEQGTRKVLEMARIKSSRAVPVFALFMSMVYFAIAKSRGFMDEVASAGCCTTMKTLSTFFDARMVTESSHDVLVARFPVYCRLLLVYDNYVKACRRVKHQRFGRHTEMLAGTMRGAGCTLIPQGLVIGAGAAAFVLGAVSLGDVLGLVSGVGLEEAWLRRQERAIQVGMRKANIGGVPYPPQFDPPSPPTLKLHTLQFSEEDSGTIYGNRQILSDFAEMFGLDSGNELTRSFAFVIGDQLTYDQMQKFGG